jgi:hypothetical protein
MPFQAAARRVGPAAQWAMRNPGQAMTRGAAGVGLAAVPAYYGYNALSGLYNTAREGIEGAVQQGAVDFMNQAMPAVNDYLDQLGLINRRTGQLDITGLARRGAGNVADQVLNAVGLDPSQMTGMQKLMILGGALGTGGGLVSGNPLVSGAGGLSLLAGLSPQIGQGLQTLTGGPQTAAGARPGQIVPRGTQTPMAVNQQAARNELAHQRAITGQ